MGRKKNERRKKEKDTGGDGENNRKGRRQSERLSTWRRSRLLLLCRGLLSFRRWRRWLCGRLTRLSLTAFLSLSALRLSGRRWRLLLSALGRGRSGCWLLGSGCGLRNVRRERTGYREDRWEQRQRDKNGAYLLLRSLCLFCQPSCPIGHLSLPCELLQDNGRVLRRQHHTKQLERKLSVEERGGRSALENGV
jgi:hypothetical protein